MAIPKGLLASTMLISTYIIIMNKITIPDSRPSVSWTDTHTYNWYHPFFGKKSWIINDVLERSRTLIQYDLNGHITWKSKQIITGFNDKTIRVDEYDLLQTPSKLIGTIYYDMYFRKDW